MAAHYRHTQQGRLMLTVLLLSAAGLATVSMLEPSSPVRLVPRFLAVGSAILAWLFSSLTVEVDENELRWYFGPGIWRYRIARADIESVGHVRNHWWNGFGIRINRGFRLYNVSGFDAVELRLKTGAVRRIGTDEPQALANALRS